MNKDELIFLENINSISQYTNKGHLALGDFGDIFSIPYLTEEAIEKLREYYKRSYGYYSETPFRFSRFIISSNTGDIVIGVKEKEETRENLDNFSINKKGGIEIKNINYATTQFVGSDADRMFNCLDRDYFENNDQFIIYDVEKDILMNFINIFCEVCYSRDVDSDKDKFIWGKLYNTEDVYYYVDIKNIINITNDRGLKLLNFVNEKEEN